MACGPDKYWRWSAVGGLTQWNWYDIPIGGEQAVHGNLLDKYLAIARSTEATAASLCIRWIEP